MQSCLAAFTGLVDACASLEQQRGTLIIVFQTSHHECTAEGFLSVRVASFVEKLAAPKTVVLARGAQHFDVRRELPAALDRWIVESKLFAPGIPRR